MEGCHRAFVLGHEARVQKSLNDQIRRAKAKASKDCKFFPCWQSSIDLLQDAVLPITQASKSICSKVVLQTGCDCTIMAWPVRDLAVIWLASLSEGFLQDLTLSISGHDGLLLGRSCVSVDAIPFSFTLSYAWMGNTQAVVAKSIAAGLPCDSTLEGLHNILRLWHGQTE